MTAYSWREFFTEGMERAVFTIELVEEMFQVKFPDLLDGLEEIEKVAVQNSIATNLVMSVFTCKVPLNIATKVFEYFIFCQNAEACLIYLLETIFTVMHERMVKMDSDERVPYIQSC